MELLRMVILVGILLPATSTKVQSANFLVKGDAPLSSPGCDQSGPYQQNGDWCYNYFEIMYYKDFDDMRSSCLQDGADLVSIHSKEEDDFLRSTWPTPWPWPVLGLQFHGGSNFTWSDGTAVDFRNLDKNYVANAENLGYCAMLGESYWINADCGVNEERRYSACKKKASLTPNYVCPDPNDIHYDSGEISSSSYPNVFYGHESCIYKMIVPNGGRVRLEIDDLNFACYDSPPNNATLIIYEGFTMDDAYIIGKCDCENRIGFIRTRSQNRMMVVFKPGYIVSKWKAKFLTV